MRYLPQGDNDLREMLAAVGVESPAELFRSIPESLRIRGDLDLPPAHSEMELRRVLGGMSAENASAATHPIFLGAGAYHHYVPAAVWQILLRSEFYTSYTPYQPEISQGTLQGIFEFQSLIASLTEMDIANASLYDGASATAEGVLMAHRLTRRPRVVLSSAIHPHYRQVVQSYVRHLGLELIAAPIGRDGRTETAKLEAAAGGDETCAIVLQSPNFHGVIEDLDAAGAVARSAGALLEVVISDPHSLGLLKGPGRFGADLVVGEAHALGMPMSFGGPFLGFMAAKQSHVRQMPGRLVGEARDAQGRRGFVLTLSTREQHIRREKATSNICTNQGLIAMAATIYMSLMGREGMREAALQCHHKASHAARLLSEVPGCRRRFSAPFFHEFVIDLPVDADKTSADLLDRGIIGGLPLGRYDRDMSRSMLFCVTEMNTREETERLAATLTEVTR